MLPCIFLKADDETTDRSMITQIAFMLFEIRPTLNMRFR